MSNVVRALFLARPLYVSLFAASSSCLVAAACVDGSPAPEGSPITGDLQGGAKSTGTSKATGSSPGTSFGGSTSSFGGSTNNGAGGYTSSSGGSFSATGGASETASTGQAGATTMGSGGSIGAGGFASVGGTSGTSVSISGGAPSQGGSPMSSGGTRANPSGGTTNGPGPGPGNGGSNTGGSNPMTGAGGSPPASGFGSAQQQGSGSTSERYQKTAVSRNGVNYFFMANGWGPGFQSQSVSWNGTSFTVASMQGKQGGNYEPASYPTVFCGVYSDSMSGQCGLPKAKSELKSLRTGWKWQANGNSGQYNAAWDIWLGDGTNIASHKSFVMVWLRDPPGQQPAGMKRFSNVQVPNSGSWDLWVGQVNGKPCLSYVRPEGQDMAQFEFDVLDFLKDLEMRGVQAPGSHVLSVAVGFEIWNGPINNLVSQDFYVAAQ